MLALSHFKQSLQGLRALSSAASAVAKNSGRGGRSSNSDKTITVFGGTGRLGRVVINSIGQTGTQVLVPHRGDHQYAQHLKMCGDLGVIHLVNLPHLGNPQDIEDVIKHSDVVINLTGAANPKLHWSLEASNVDLTHRLARAAKNCGVKTFIHMSHINASEHSPSEYLRTKHLSEVVVRHELPDTSVIVRASDCFGRMDNFSDKIIQTMKPLIPGDVNPLETGTCKQWKMGKVKSMVPVYAPDVARAVAKIALMHPEDREELYQFIGPKRYTMDEFCRTLVDLTYIHYDPVEDRFGPIKAKLTKNDWWTRIHTISDTPADNLPGFAELDMTSTTFESVALGWLACHRPYFNTYDPMDERADKSLNIY